MGISDHLTHLLINLNEGQEATVRTLYETIDWFRIEEGFSLGFLSPCSFNLYTEHIMRNTKVDELQAGIKIGRENTNNLRYEVDTTLMEEIEEELQNFLMRVKEESERASLKLNIKKKKTLRSWHLAHYFMANRRGKYGSSDRFPLLGLSNHYRW